MPSFNDPKLADCEQTFCTIALSSLATEPRRFVRFLQKQISGDLDDDRLMMDRGARFYRFTSTWASIRVACFRLNISLSSISRHETELKHLRKVVASTRYAGMVRPQPR
jgi:hypothetical protein